MKRKLTAIFSAFLFTIMLASCRTFNPDDTTGNVSYLLPNYLERQCYPATTTVSSQFGMIRLHKESGEMVELSGWNLDASTHELHGVGKEYDRDRFLTRTISREDALPLRQYALVELDKIHDGGLTEQGTLLFGLLVVYAAIIIASIALFPHGFYLF